MSAQPACYNQMLGARHDMCIFWAIDVSIMSNSFWGAESALGDQLIHVAMLCTERPIVAECASLQQAQESIMAAPGFHCRKVSTAAAQD